MGAKMYKVWNSSRMVKKSLVASSLRELQRKGCEKLGYSEPVQVVLEEDGTIVEDEEYFELLEQNTTFILLTQGETWKPVWETASTSEDTVDHVNGSPDTPRIEQLTAILRTDLTKLVTFSKQDLQELVDTDHSQLTNLLGCKAAEATTIQDSCQRYLDEQFEADEALRLVHMLAESVQSDKPDEAGEGDGPIAEKRRRLDT